MRKTALAPLSVQSSAISWALVPVPMMAIFLFAKSGILLALVKEAVLRTVPLNVSRFGMSGMMGLELNRPEARTRCFGRRISVPDGEMISTS